MLRKLWPLLLLAGCFQQGLVATDKEPVESGVNGGGTGDDDPETEEAKIRTERKTGTSFTLTSFANPAYPSSKPIKGYGDGDSINGETLCFSNENESNTNTFDSITDCRRPLASSRMPTEEHDMAAEFERVTKISSPSKTPFILQALQLYFSNTPSGSAPEDKHFSTIDTANLKISVITAPLLYTSSTGYFSWDHTKLKHLRYNPNSTSDCTLGEQDATGFDLRYDTNIPIADRYKHFITGLWVFERAITRPYESVAKSSNPVPSFSNGTSGPHNLFSSRTNVFGSLIIPEIADDANKTLTYKFFPGKNPPPDEPYTPTEEAEPYKYTFGYYRYSQVSGVSTSGEDTRGTSQNVNGAFVTPVMGKYESGAEILDNGNSPGWNKRVIVGLCIQGTRTIYTGKLTSEGDPADDPVTHPVVHAIKYEARKIKLYSQ